MQKAVPDKTGRRKLTSFVKTVVQRTARPESAKLRSENEALWAQAKNVGQELLATRSRLEIAEAQQSDELRRLRAENEALQGQARSLGLELLDARNRLDRTDATQAHDVRQLQSENGALRAQATGLGRELLDTRSRLELSERARAEDVSRLQAECETLRAQARSLALDLHEARERVDSVDIAIAERMKTLQVERDALYDQASNLGRELLDTRGRLAHAELDHAEDAKRLKTEIEALTAQAKILGVELVETRRKLELSEAARNEQRTRVQADAEGLRTQVHGLGLELADERTRLEALEKDKERALIVRSERSEVVQAEIKELRGYLQNAGLEFVNIRTRLELLEKWRESDRAMVAYYEKVGRLQGENEALRAQATNLGREVLDTRAQLETVGSELLALREQAAKAITVTADEFSRYSDLWDARFPWPEAYQAVTAALRRRVEERPDDIQARLDLIDAYLLAPAGGPALFERAMPLVESSFDPKAAVDMLNAGLRLIPGEPALSARLRSARRMATSPILIAALAKSGSEYVFHALRKGLGKQWIRGVDGGTFPNNAAVEFGLHRLVTARGISKGHMCADSRNLFILFKHFRIERVVVHVRDPRQAMISFAHFMPAVARDPIQSLDLSIPPNYSKWSFKRQLDWQIEHWLPQAIRWIVKWLEAEDLSWVKGRLLFTTFEDMVRNRSAFFQQILDFHRIDPDLYDANAQAEPKRKGEMNFRRGLVDEWRSVLTPAQIKRVSALMPRQLSDRFGWPR
jgi:Sulfotransferase domain